MTKVSDAYKWDEIAQLTDEDMDNLLGFWPIQTVPTLAELQALRQVQELGLFDEDVFDGSFGFAVGV